MGAFLDIRGVDGVIRRGIDVYKLFSSAAAGASSHLKTLNPSCQVSLRSILQTPEKLPASHSDGSISLLRFLL